MSSRVTPEFSKGQRVAYRPMSYSGTIRGTQGTVIFANAGIKGETETSYSVAWDRRHPGLPGIVREQHIEQVRS